MPTSLWVAEGTKLLTHRCWCGIWYAMPESLYREHVDNGHTTYCPLGHAGVVTMAAKDKLREQLDRANAQLTNARDQAEAAERRAAAARGQVTKIKNRVKNGVCPFCKRTFPNLANHMESNHAEEPASE